MNRDIVYDLVEAGDQKMVYTHVMNEFVDILSCGQCSLDSFQAQEKKLQEGFELWSNLLDLVHVTSLH